MLPSQYILLFIGGIFCICGLWRTSSLSWQTSSVRASIEFDLSIPASSPSILHRSLNKTSKKTSDRKHRKYHGSASRYMLQLYHRRPDADIIRALQPMHVSGPSSDGTRILLFSVPPDDLEETLEIAELLATAGTILRVNSFKEVPVEKACKWRRDDNWRVFNVTSAITSRNGNLVRLYVYGRIGYRPCGDIPILLLSYSKSKRKRLRRSIPEPEDHEEPSPRWDDDGTKRRRRNSCRRRSLYVDFALIAYDEWVVAPPGYEAYQCTGKCFYPFGDHLSPTKHAIVQTLIHGALQGTEGFNVNKPVGRACCVPTRLAPTSLLYLDASGTLTYQYGYEDMVVAECGCR